MEIEARSEVNLDSLVGADCDGHDQPLPCTVRNGAGVAEARARTRATFGMYAGGRGPRPEVTSRAVAHALCDEDLTKSTESCRVEALGEGVRRSKWR
jgi:hypothetical protein